MAILNLNPLVNSMHGKQGNSVHYFRRGVQCSRSYTKPENPDTEPQRFIRRSFGDAVRSWQAMSESERYAFNRKARFMSMSGYNLFISGYMRENIGKNPALPAAPMRNSGLAQSCHVRINSVSEPLPGRYRPEKGIIPKHPRPG